MNWAKVKYSSDKETISKKWDNVSVKYHYSFLETAILNNLDFTPGSILDVGAGFGHWSKFYNDIFPQAKTTALDLSQNVKGFEFIEADIKDYCYGNYDIVNAIGVLHHLMSDKSLQKAVDNIYRMTNKIAFIGTRFDFLTTPREKNRKFRTLEYWKSSLGSFSMVSIIRSNPAIHIRKHLDLIVCRK